MTTHRTTHLKALPYLFYPRAALSWLCDVDAPADQPFGDRIYLAKDPEGHEWYFAQHIHDVAIEDLAARLFGRERR